MVCQSRAAERESDTVKEGIQAVLDGQLPRFYLEYPHHAHPQHWFSMSVTPINDAGQIGAVVSLENISERVAAQDQIRELAFYDPLTQLPNRRLVSERLAQQIARAQRSQIQLALLFIDLDHFKPINDELGHDVGDWLLQAVAQRIQQCLRASDTAGRMGGDEFVALLSDQFGSTTALAVAEKIRLALAQEFVTEQGAVLHISSSIGVALYPDHGQTEKDLLRLGDEAMYRAKKSGRNAVVLCRPEAPHQVSAASGTPATPWVQLRWKPAFTCGHTLIDQQHRALFELANALLEQATVQPPQPREFDAAFDRLLTHIRQHFAEEETLLQRLGWVDVAQHALLHNTLLARAQALHADFSAAPQDPVVTHKLVKFLLSELVANHMLVADRVFFSFFSTQDTAQAS
ncbi:response regulator PleD [mine drainage metagenome]|uniref:Response regulator PleD n=1 Tax=mine drainage metagenome TaxID=410659 RepID=A0A1J5PZN3_9ZZZZ